MCASANEPLALGAYASPFSISLSRVHDRVKGEEYRLRRRIAAQGADQIHIIFGTLDSWSAVLPSLAGWVRAIAA